MTMERVEEVERGEGEGDQEDVEGKAAGTPAAEASTAEAPPASAELKVVIQMKGERALVGVQGDGTDPVMETLEAGSLEAVLDAVPGIVAQARERWATSPRNPKYEGPPAPPAPTPAPGQPARRAAAPRVETPRMF
jgi:hypothetical protein